MNPGNNFAQMARSRKFGFGNGRGQAGGMGEGQMGTSGYAAMDGSSLNVMGNESSARAGSAAARQSSRYGKGAGTLAAGDKGRTRKSRRDERIESGQPPIRRRLVGNGHRGIQRLWWTVISRPSPRRKEKPVKNQIESRKFGFGCIVVLALGAFALRVCSEPVKVAPAAPVHSDLTLLQCGNLIYAGNQSSVCFADHFLSRLGRSRPTCGSTRNSARCAWMRTRCSTTRSA